MEDQVNIPDSAAGAIGLGGGLLATFLEIIRVETVVDAAVVAVVTVVLSFYVNRLLRWIHGDIKKKDT